MNETQSSRLRRILCVAAVVGSIAGASAGCGHSDQVTDTTTGQGVNTSASVNPHAAPSQLPTAESLNVSRDSGTAVMLAMCQIVFTRNTQAEADYSSSYARAAQLMTPQLRGQLVQPPKGVRPLPQWADWQRSKAWVNGTCQIAADEHPADTPTSQSRVLAVDEQAYDSDGLALSPTGASVWATATREGGQWSVSRFDVVLRDS